MDRKEQIKALKEARKKRTAKVTKYERKFLLLLTYVDKGFGFSGDKNNDQLILDTLKEKIKKQLT